MAGGVRGQIAAWNTVVRVNGVPFQIVGVAPPQFRGLIAGQVPKVYLPVSTFADVNPGWHEYDDWALRWLNAFMRIPGNASRTAAQAELQPVYRAAVRQELASEVPQPDEYVKELSYEHMSIVPASQGVHAVLDEWDEPLGILQWMSLAVLFLAAINVAGLMLVRGVRQKQETLIRYAIGATCSAVTRLHFLETLILAPDSAEIHAALGQLLIASGLKVDGQQALATAIRPRPNDSPRFSGTIDSLSRASDCVTGEDADSGHEPSV